MAAIDHHDPDRDLPLSHDYIEIFRNKIHMKKSGPHGWWFLNLDKGEIPERFQGAYLNYSMALGAAQQLASFKKVKYGKDTVDAT